MHTSSVTTAEATKPNAQSTTSRVSDLRNLLGDMICMLSQKSNQQIAVVSTEGDWVRAELSTLCSLGEWRPRPKQT
jgi:hypothetical protein